VLTGDVKCSVCVFHDCRLHGNECRDIGIIHGMSDVKSLFTCYCYINSSVDGQSFVTPPYAPKSMMSLQYTEQT
jgi:hypothetical protein